MAKKNHSKQKSFTGVVEKNVKGFAFVRLENEKKKDIYLSAEEAAPLMSGDRIELLIHSNGFKPYGEVKKILTRAKKEVAGRVSKYQKHWLLTTDDGNTFLLEGKGFQKDDFVLAKIVDYPTYYDPGRVQLTQNWGLELTPESDLAITIAEFGLPSQFSSEVIEEAFLFKLKMKQIFETEMEHRRDLTEKSFVTIDGEDAKDFDDAILVETFSGEVAFKLYVAIADVSFFVTPDSVLDKEARFRATSVYFPGTCIPMLPPVLSEDLCSLRPQEKKLAFVCEIDLDKDGETLKSEVYEAVIKTKARLTYNEVDAFQKGEKEIDAPLKAAFNLYRKLKKLKIRRGALDFEILKGKVIVDAKGFPTELVPETRLESNELIELFMVLANEEVARFLRENKEPSLYRVHAPPDPSSQGEINKLLKNFGIDFRLQNLEPRSLSALLDKTKKNPHLKWLHPFLLRLQKQALYEPDPKGHFGLALQDYTHFTSPIRRYPDLVVHRSLKKLLGTSKKTDTDYEDLNENLDDLGAWCSERERTAMEAERFILKRKQAWFFKNYLGETFETLISGFGPRGLFVEVVEWGGAEGMIPMENLLENYEYDEEHHVFRRVPKGKILKFGDSITAQLIQASPEEGKVTFAEVRK